jgi:hypothetical protein
MQAGMGRQLAVALYVVAMVVVIFGVDFAFFRNRFWERLTANIGVVLVFAAFYLRFLRRPWNKARRRLFMLRSRGRDLHSLQSQPP